MIQQNFPKAFLSLLAVALCASSSRAQVCATARANFGPSGEADATSGPNSPNLHRRYLSGNGRLIAFWSDATNLVAGDTNGVSDVFVFDRVTNTHTRVSVDSSGVEANGASSDPTLSADGRFVAFQSSADNLVAGDTNARTDVFLHDLQTSQTVRISVASSGVEGDGNSTRPDISSDGARIGYHSTSSNLVAGDTNTFSDVFVFEAATGQTLRVSVDSNGTEADGPSSNASISGDGMFVAFHSAASNLVAGDTNATFDVFVRELATNQTARVSVGSNGEQGDFFSQTPSISNDGRYVAFSSIASTLVFGDTNNLFDVFVKDRVTGGVRRVSAGLGGFQSNATSQGNSISGDGRYIAFLSAASNLVANDTNGGPLLFQFDAFVYDTVTSSNTRVNVTTQGAEAELNSNTWNVCLSNDGQTVAYYSTATNLVPNDTNAVVDVFVSGCLTRNPPVGFCFGDGSGTACPCGNSGLPGRGCENSLQTGGALLDSSGSAAVSNDSLTLHLQGVGATASCLFFQGSQTAGGGAGTVFGDGLRCAAGTVLRLGTHTASGGQAAYGAAVAGDQLISQAGQLPQGASSTRYYQVWYRNVASFCTPDAFNFSNGLAVVWIP